MIVGLNGHFLGMSAGMGAFGDRLRREREMRGVTLDEISESTKISRRSLEALEQEKFNTLPGGIFNKGFVRSYARYLGIDEEQAVADYVEASHDVPPPEDQFPLEIHEENEKKPPLNPKRSVVPVTLALVLLVVGLAGWIYWVKFRPQQVTEAAEQPPRNPGVPSSAAAPVPAPPSGSGMNPASSEVPSENKTATEAGGDSTDTAAPDKKQNASATDSKAVDMPEMKDPARAFTVQVKAKEDSWVHIVADGKMVFDRVLPANEEHSVKAGRELVLKIGNAAGVEVSYQGKPLGALGEQGKPRTLTFNAAGLQP